jgi:hypothetical protein
MDAKQIIEKFDKLKGERGIWEEHWQEVMDYVLPRKNNVIRKDSEGAKKGSRLYDATGVQSCELLAGALHGMLTNPSSIWFELTTGDDELDQNDEVRAWLQKVGHTMHQTLNNSNFQTEIHEVYLDLVAPGTALMDILEDDDKDVRFSARMISEAMVEENNKGVIDSVYRSFSWTARNIVLEFGDKNLPDKIRSAYENNRGDKFEIIHAVYPRDLESLSPAKKASPQGYAFASHYILKEDKIDLSESGFQEFPYVVPRWTKATGETYGRSPGMKALPDIKMLNKMKEAVIKSAQKTVDPPFMAPDDGFVMPFRFTPGGANFYRSGTQDKIEFLQTNARVDIGHELIQDTRQQVRESFYIDQLQLNQGPQMTATEVQQRTEEKMRLLGPMLGRQQAELLAPMIERVFAILARKKRLPAMPEVLKGKAYQVRYSSLIAKAQRTSEAQNLNRVIEAISPFVQTSPDVMDNFDSDQAAKFAAQIYGLPAKILRDDKDVKNMRAQRAQQQQAAAQQQQQAHQAEVAAKVAPAAAKAKDAGLI